MKVKIRETGDQKKLEERIEDLRDRYGDEAIDEILKNCITDDLEDEATMINSDLDDFVVTMNEKVKVRWEADWMLAEVTIHGEKVSLYAQDDDIIIEDIESETTYEMLKADIIQQAEEIGYPVENLQFWWDAETKAREKK